MSGGGLVIGRGRRPRPAPPPAARRGERVVPLIAETRLKARVAELAADIAARLGDDFVVVGLLKGSFVFVADLVRALYRCGAAPAVTFLALSSYGAGTESRGRVRRYGPPPDAVSGRPVLLVDDVADSGRSLAFARDLLTRAGARPIRTCVLVDKPGRRVKDVTLDFVGFTVGDLFVVGYGIDHAERHRCLPYIGALA